MIKPAPPAPGAPRRPFTLIELLVVVAIISVLASMLLPAITRARNAARRITCVNQMKQLHGLMFNYAESYDDWLPGNSEGNYPHRLYFTGGTSSYKQTGQPYYETGGDEWQVLGRLFWCPTSPFTLNYRNQSRSESGYTAYLWLNNFYHDPNVARPDRWHGGRLGQYTVEMTLVQDWLTLNEDNPKIHSSHESGANILAGDGHVEFRSRNSNYSTIFPSGFGGTETMILRPTASWLTKFK